MRNHICRILSLLILMQLLIGGASAEQDDTSSRNSIWQAAADYADATALFFGQLKDGIAEAATSAANAAGRFVTSAGNHIMDAWCKAADALSATGYTVKSALSEGVDNALNWMYAVFIQTDTWLTSLIDGLFRIIAELLRGLFIGIVNFVHEHSDHSSEAASRIRLLIISLFIGS